MATAPISLLVEETDQLDATDTSIAAARRFPLSRVWPDSVQVLGGRLCAVSHPREDVAPCTPGAELLTDRQARRLRDLFATDEHVAVQATWGIYPRLNAAYRHPDRLAGGALMA